MNMEPNECSCSICINARATQQSVDQLAAFGKRIKREIFEELNRTARTPLAELRSNVNAQQWLDVADARERQERHADGECTFTANTFFSDPDAPEIFSPLPEFDSWLVRESEPFAPVEFYDRWWFKFLVAIVILITVCSLYVLSCGADPYGGCKV